MGIKWEKTKFPGIRSRKHLTRKHGVQFDRYFAIYYQLDGKRKEEGVGWASKGWTPAKVFSLLNELKANHKTGMGPQTLAEKGKLKREMDKKEQAEMTRLEKENISFGEFFKDTYWPVAKTSKTTDSYKAERIYFNKWIDPVIGKMTFKDIRPMHIIKVRKNMLEAKKPKSRRTIEYVFAIIRQIWNLARQAGLINTKSPTKEIKKLKFDNKRLRFLSHDEAGALLDELKSRSLQLHNISLLSLHCGLRASEVFNLAWGKVDLDRGIITVDGKGDKSRPAFMTEGIKAMFESLKKGNPDDLVFPDRKGKKIKRMSYSFTRAVDELGLNDGVTDDRMKVVLHTCRHTFASWLVEDGTNLYTVQKLMGHSTLAQTERYSHLSPDYLQNAVRRFDRKIKKSKKTANIINISTA